jgi:hypothetical protein
MRKYRINASSIVRIEFGIELAAGLQHFAETAPRASAFEKLNDDLNEQFDKRRALRKPLLQARAALRFAEYHVDQTIRTAIRAAEMIDGGRRGTITTALFPKGVKPVVRPPGRGQIQPTRDLVSRLETCMLPGIDAYRAEWLPKLKGALSQLEGAAAAHSAAQDAYDIAFRTELGMREAHVHEVDRLMGLVRAAFPRDRVLQDVIFPVVEDGSAADGPADPAPTPDDPAPLSAQPA